jgi:GMP synthase (glutamine-hydrolysing)
VHPATEFEIGWYPVELSDAASDDPVLGGLPQRFDAFQWHYYTYDLPAGAVELARSAICTQAFRLGGNAWGVQFHPEVTLPQVQSWVDEKEEVPIDDAALMAETSERIGAWNDLGRALCGAFVTAAERVAVTA